MKEVIYLSKDGYIVSYIERNNPYGNWTWKRKDGTIVDKGIARGIWGLEFKLPFLKEWRRRGDFK